VPLQTARLCADVVRLAEDAAPILNGAVISDVLVGAILAQAALESAALNVEINVGSMTDAAAASEFSSGLERARSGIGDAVERVLGTGRSRFPHASAKS
jgi:formiminotetrahydrofolate cyclodeaminase